MMNFDRERLGREFREMIVPLCEAGAPTGFEQEAEEVVRRYLPEGFELSTDRLHNLIAHKPGKGPKRAVVAHLDEIGLLVRIIDSRGFLWFETLAGGQPQRGALARSLVPRPKLLLLDEPFAALDSHLRDKLQMELRGLLADFGHDVLLVTHSRDEAYHLCRRVAVLERGRLLAVKATKELFADPGSVAAATLTGCKNIAPAHKTGEYEVEVPDWGIRLQTAQPVGDGVKAVGIRAHYFNTKTAQNRYPVAYLGEMEEPFEWIVEFRYEGQRPGTPPIWWRIPKDRRPQTFPSALGAAPVNVLLLYE